ncbi:MAG: hypothetical protein KAY22_26335 [Rhizorhabdus sp.]|nr:hypothetical protein [Rhizorhabdus sp.]
MILHPLVGAMCASSDLSAMRGAVVVGVIEFEEGDLSLAAALALSSVGRDDL